ncbi:DUF4350 domain-containing protein [Caldivirga sp. UBA161]|uniref:DUF4350 domain-containing protein n=1 Tax=Caldivirga sp. UBA161 TaxID=1915569 RepID=UPI0025C4AD5E|nr:DUF4350 domain-containing protein [Caldivirga sp. UBA161]
MRGLYAVIALSLTLALLITYIYPYTAPYSPSNSGWDGYSMAVKACLKPIYTPLEVNGSRVVFVIPLVKLPEAYINALRGLLLKGGVVVILGNLPTVNQLLSELGVNVTVTGMVIKDPLFNSINEYFPIAVVKGYRPLNITPMFIVLDNATVIKINGNASSIALTGLSSIAGNETGPFTVMAVARYGGGYVLIASSPGIFMNSLLGKGSNMLLLRELCSIGPSAYLIPALGGFQVEYRAVLMSIYYSIHQYPVNYLVSMSPILALATLMALRRIKAH